MALRFFSCAALLALFSATARAQSLPPPLLTTYQYTTYTTYDTTDPNPPTPNRNVAGTLTLRSDSTYAKHFILIFKDGPHAFDQTGRFSIRHDSIRFAFTDRKGADVQRGTFRYEPASRLLTVSIAGYPPGNKGVYELVVPPTSTPPRPGPPPPAKKPRPRR